MEFNLDDLNPGVKFFFDDASPEKGSVTLRACPGDIMADIEKKTTVKRIEYKRGQRFEVVDKKENKWRELFYDYVIVDWENVTAKGEPLECTKENKVMLMGKSPVFSVFVADRLEKLNNELIDRAEDAEKN